VSVWFFCSNVSNLLAVLLTPVPPSFTHARRPAYLRLGSVLRGLRVPCVLALTATATALTCRAVMESLGIPPDGLVASPSARPNLAVSVSCDSDRCALMNWCLLFFF
jgi:ATP-dependent DNA helicase Q4